MRAAEPDTIKQGYFFVFCFKIIHRLYLLYRQTGTIASKSQTITFMHIFSKFILFNYRIVDSDTLEKTKKVKSGINIFLGIFGCHFVPIGCVTLESITSLPQIFTLLSPWMHFAAEKAAFQLKKNSVQIKSYSMILTLETPFATIDGHY